ncbi:TyeA family type III secretion system gatekeeper subunit [Vibrio sp. S4M6]|uniref:TyeA family type III secretion system gatekeeper subunit n=1 Tax=Vibrio sinus TaxID=2946865 RepID=UPI002029C547|nr:TyeA family type III secretion system gatekeeper subunit [Vibrio sinus]MCL9783821.1 TyeA family type III secretion system gatekeeper subunit [Vibrio sinus]
MDNAIKTTGFSNPQLFTDTNDSSAATGVKQHFPGSSIQESVQATLVDIKQGAIEEAMEEASLALGGKLKDLKLGKDKSRSELDRSKELLDKLIKQINGVDPAQLAQLAAKYPGAAEAADPLAFLRQAGASNSEIALILSFMLSQEGLSPKQKKRLEKALQDLLEQADGLGIELFTYLEFGPAMPQVAAQLKKIYQQACDDGLELAELFMKLKDLPDRRKKLKALIRGLAFDLCSQGEVAQGSKLASIVKDMRKLLLFFGLDDQCEHIAKQMNKLGGHITGIAVVEELVMMTDQAWVYADWIDSRVQQLGFTDISHKLNYLRNVKDMIKYMPEPCFNEDDQRQQILDSCSEVLSMYADME